MAPILSVPLLMCYFIAFSALHDLSFFALISRNYPPLNIFCEIRIFLFSKSTWYFLSSKLFFSVFSSKYPTQVVLNSKCVHEIKICVDVFLSQYHIYSCLQVIQDCLAVVISKICSFHSNCPLWITFHLHTQGHFQTPQSPFHKDMRA